MAKYEERVLLKLRRQYSQHEAVALLNEKLTAAEILIGQLKSEAAHLEHQLKERDKEIQNILNDDKKVFIAARKEIRKEEMYLNIRNLNKQLTAKNRKLKKLLQNQAGDLVFKLVNQ